MLESVRARLALWHTAVLGALLVALAAASYLLLARALDRRTDRYLAETASAFDAELVAERADEATDSAAVEATVRELRFRDLRTAVYTPAGALLTASPPAVLEDDGRGAELAALDLRALGRRLPALGSSGTAFLHLPGPAGGFRAFTAPAYLGGASYRVAIVQSRRGETETLAAARRGFLIVLPVVLLLAWAGGYLLARRSLRPVVEMSRHAARIGATSLHERLPVGVAGDELGQLAVAFNDLLSRLDRAFEQQRRFMADASHELRTPVAIVRGEAEIALARDDRTGEEYRESLRVLRDEGTRLSAIVDDLFLLARADAGQMPLRPADLYLDELVTEAARAARSLAAARGVALTCAPAPETPYHGDEALLQRLILNLLDNAIKFTPRGGAVHVALAREVDGYRITVRDTGGGVAPEARTRIFDRFWRGNGAASGEEREGGAGLGLAIARWVAEAHAGAIELADSSPAGSTFAVRLPLAAPAGA